LTLNGRFTHRALSLLKIALKFEETIIVNYRVEDSIPEVSRDHQKLNLKYDTDPSLMSSE